MEIGAPPVVDAPRNALEKAIVDARNGRIPQREFLHVLVRNMVYVLSTTVVEPDGRGLRPLLHRSDLEPGSETRAAVFTDPERATEASRLGNAPYLLQITGLEFLRRVPPDLGIILNPGSIDTLHVKISAIGVARIVRDADAGAL